MSYSFSTSLSTLVTFSFLDYSHPSMCEVLCHCGIDLHLCMCVSTHFCTSSFENVYSDPLLILKISCLWDFPNGPVLKILCSQCRGAPSTGRVEGPGGPGGGWGVQVGPGQGWSRKAQDVDGLSGLRCYRRAQAVACLPEPQGWIHPQ